MLRSSCGMISTALLMTMMMMISEEKAVAAGLHSASRRDGDSSAAVPGGGGSTTRDACPGPPLRAPIWQRKKGRPAVERQIAYGSIAGSVNMALRGFEVRTQLFRNICCITALIEYSVAMHAMIP
jgi:hypothetical protein